MAEMPGMIRPDLQALPQVRDRMTFLYLELAQACGQMLDGTFPRTRGGDPTETDGFAYSFHFSPHTRGVILSCSALPEKAPSFPRTRGGDPITALNSALTDLFSPHTRG